MTKAHILLSVCVLTAAAALLIGCQQNGTPPRPEFPLSAEGLTTALEETGLPWIIEQEVRYRDGMIAYNLKRPEDREGYAGVRIASRDSAETGRRLHITFSELPNKYWWPAAENDTGWEDWRDMLTLVARLYGGFEDAEEIYRACSATALPQDKYLLWEGTLTGGYFYMNTMRHMRPERFEKGNSVYFTVYESEEAYLKHRKIVEESREKKAPQ